MNQPLPFLSRHALPTPSCTAALLSAMIGGIAQADPAVDVWLTRGDQSVLLQPQNSVNFVDGIGESVLKINIDPTSTYQTMHGFGGAMTESSAWLIQNRLNESQRSNLMDALFSPTAGAGFSYLRVPMGSSDFALSPYTYNDLPSGQVDPTLSSFSLARDEAYVIPALVQAAAINPNLKLMGTPWSPPAWMKTNGSLNGGSLQSQYYDAYADYFVKFVEGYAAHGLNVRTVTPANEPLNPTEHYPSISMSTFEQSNFIGDHLGPAFAAAALETGILAFDHNWSDWNYPVIVANDPEASQYIQGAAFHGYSGSVDQQSNFADFFPDLEVHFTEITAGSFSNTSSEQDFVWSLQNALIGAIRNAASTSIYWNLALDENGGPNLPGASDELRGLVTIDSQTGDVDYNPEYFAYAHLSKFVQPGALRMDSDSIDAVMETVAFLNPDGSEVLVALNPGGVGRTMDVVRDGASFPVFVEARSVVTLQWQPEGTIAGDIDGNGIVDAVDLALLESFLNDPNLTVAGEPDVNGDGQTDALDALFLATDESLLSLNPADFNGDGVVSLLDLDRLGANWRGDGFFTQGDSNGDGVISLLDLDILGANWGTNGLAFSSAAAQVIPEPGMATIVAMGCGAFWTRRKTDRV